MKAVGSSETLAPTCENKWLYIPEVYNINTNGHENFESQRLWITLYRPTNQSPGCSYFAGASNFGFQCLILSSKICVHLVSHLF
jgi:hypothetical protein